MSPRDIDTFNWRKNSEYASPPCERTVYRPFDSSAAEHQRNFAGALVTVLRFNDRRTTENHVYVRESRRGANLLTEDRCITRCTRWSVCKALNRSARVLLMGRTTVHWIACGREVRAFIHSRRECETLLHRRSCIVCCDIAPGRHRATSKPLY